MMRKIIASQIVFPLLLGLVALGSFIFIHSGGIKLAQAAAGDIRITVTREAALGALSGATIEILCTGGAYTQLTGSPTTDGSGVVLAAPQGASSCDDLDTLSIRVTRDGYVQKVEGALTYLAASDPNIYTVLDVQFSHKVLVKDELNADLSPDSVSVPSTSCGGVGNTFYCPISLADDTTLSDGYIILKSGYESTLASEVPLASERSAHTDAQVVTSMDASNGLNFAYRINVIENEIGVSIMPAAGTPWTGSGGLTLSSQQYDAGTTAWYLAVSGTGNLALGIDGYVTANITASPTAVSQTVSTNDFIDLEFAYKITGISSEVLLASLTATTSILEVGDASGRNTCTLFGGSWYCPVLLANSNGTMIARVQHDGYVEKLNYALVLGTTRLSNDTLQISDTIAGLEYAVKATVTKAHDFLALSDATVTAGNALAVSCVENAATGIYFCAVPIAHTASTVNVAKSGYLSNTGSYNDRTAATDAQATVLISLSLVPSGVGGAAAPPTCSSVRYGEWQNPCVGGVQYRNIFGAEAGCSITSAQRAEAERSCNSGTVSENPSSPSSEQSLIEQITALEKSLSTAVNRILTNSLLGRILLQVQSHGEAWYLNPLDSSRYYMGRPLDAFNLMRRFALGINNADTQEFLAGVAPERLSGRILLNVDDHGKAYYVNPVNLKLYYLGNPNDAFTIMKSFGLGITNVNIRQIKVGT